MAAVNLHAVVLDVGIEGDQTAARQAYARQGQQEVTVQQVVNQFSRPFSWWEAFSAGFGNIQGA